MNAEDKANIDAIRSHTNRIRTALRLLPKDIRERGEGMNREEDIRDDLYEIMGSAAAIAELLDIEL